MAAWFGSDFFARLHGPDGKEHESGPLVAPNKDGGTSRVLRDTQASPGGQAHAPAPPRAEISEASSIAVHYDGRLVVIRVEALPATPDNRRRNQIIAITAAVIAISSGFAALWPSILTRPGVDPKQTRITSPAAIQPPQIKQSGGIKAVPAPGPARPRAAAPPAPVSNDSTSIAKTAPVLDNRGAINAQPRPAANRFALTEAEKAAVERGLRELKAAKEAKQ